MAFDTELKAKLASQSTLAKILDMFRCRYNSYESVNDPWVCLFHPAGGPEREHQRPAGGHRAAAPEGSEPHGPAQPEGR